MRRSECTFTEEERVTMIRNSLPFRKRMYRKLGQMFMRWAETAGAE